MAAWAKPELPFLASGVIYRSATIEFRCDFEAVVSLALYCLGYESYKDYVILMQGINSNKMKEKKEEILKSWETRCLKEVPSAGTGTSLALRDSLPLYLDHLSEALATNRRMDFRSVFAHDKESGRIGRKHGIDRASNRSYRLTEVIFEYHILREIIFQVLEAENNISLSIVQRDIILDSVEQAVNDASVEFSEIHTDIQQKFVNTLTHDLRTPITAASLSADLIIQDNALPDEVKYLATRIRNSLGRVNSMIYDLLDGSKLRAGQQLALQTSPCDLEQIMREVVEEMKGMHGDRFIVKSNGPVRGQWGQERLRRAFENLIGNAVKYGSLDTKISLMMKASQSMVEIIVHNQGNPIAADELPLMFEDFRRSKSAMEGTETGWGLGLTLVKGVVSDHKGQVRVESTAEKGTSFIIELPRIPEIEDERIENPSVSL